MGKHGRKRLFFLLSIIMCVFFSGCGYSREEKAQMKEYEKQASENAVNYISDKYGFEARVIETECEKLEHFTFLDFWPGATGDVLVHMQYEGQEFLVFISGTEQTKEGMDNYQIEQVEQAIKEQANELTGFSAQEIKFKYGSSCRGRMDLNKNGLVHTYYDGTNLSHVLSENDCQIVYSCIDENLASIDTKTVKEVFGDGEMLFVSYRSDDDFEAAGKRNFNMGGFPLAYGIEDKSLYIREYRAVGGNDEEYVEYDLREQDGVYYVPSDSDSQVSLTKTVMDDASNWNGRGFLNAKQVLENAYLVETETNALYLFIPLDILDDCGSDDDVGMIVYQYEDESGTQYAHAVTWLSDDGKYLVGTIYMRDYSKLKISVLRDIDREND